VGKCLEKKDESTTQDKKEVVFAKATKKKSETYVVNIEEHGN